MNDYNPRQDKDIDSGIINTVETLRSGNVETFESCQGGKGHAFHEPTIRFHGNLAEGFRALAYAQQHGLRVMSLRRYWTMTEEEPHGPWWEMVFLPPGE